MVAAALHIKDQSLSVYFNVIREHTGSRSDFELEVAFLRCRNCTYNIARSMNVRNSDCAYYTSGI